MFRFPISQNATLVVAHVLFLGQKPPRFSYDIRSHFWTATRHTINIAAIIGCVQYNVSFVNGYAPAQTICTASKMQNFTSASERIGSDAPRCLLLTTVTGRNTPAPHGVLKGFVKLRRRPSRSNLRSRDDTNHFNIQRWELSSSMCHCYDLTT